MFGLGAGAAGAILAVAGDVEDRAELVLDGEGFFISFAAGVVVDGGQDGEGLFALEQDVIGVGRVRPWWCSGLSGWRR